MSNPVPIVLPFIPFGTLLAQAPLPGAGGETIMWVATGGTYGLIGALIYAVRYLAKRDEKSTEALVAAFQTALKESTAATSAVTEQAKLAKSDLEGVKARMTTLEAAMAGRCPFLGANDLEDKEATARHLATRLLRQDSREHPPHPPHAGA